MLILQNFIRGSRGVNSVVGLQPCGDVFWILYAVFVLILIALGAFGIFYARYTYKCKVGCGYEFIEGDIKWTWTQIVVLTAYSSVGFMLATFVGIGPGAMITPLLLQLGLNAFSCAATQAYISQFTVIANSIQFAFVGVLNYEFMGWFFIWSISATFMGMMLMNKIVELTG